MDCQGKGTDLMSEALDKPCRTRAEAALDVAIAALKEIVDAGHLFYAPSARRTLERIAELTRKEPANGD